MQGFAEFGRNKELAQKIKTFVALAPVATVKHIKGLFQVMSKVAPELEVLSTLTHLRLRLFSEGAHFWTFVVWKGLIFSVTKEWSPISAGGSYLRLYSTFSLLYELTPIRLFVYFSLNRLINFFSEPDFFKEKYLPVLGLKLFPKCFFNLLIFGMKISYYRLLNVARAIFLWKFVFPFWVHLGPKWPQKGLLQFESVNFSPIRPKMVSKNVFMWFFWHSIMKLPDFFDLPRRGEVIWISPCRLCVWTYLRTYVCLLKAFLRIGSYDFSDSFTWWRKFTQLKKWPCPIFLNFFDCFGPKIWPKIGFFVIFPKLNPTNVLIFLHLINKWHNLFFQRNPFCLFLAKFEFLREG